MKLQQVSDNCFAALNERNRVCDANSGLINLGGGVVIDTQADLPHARRMIELFGKVWPGMPRRVVNTRADGGHVWGNQLFEGAEIIAHRAVPGRMKEAADLRAVQKLLDDASRLLPRLRLRALHPGALAAADTHALVQVDISGEYAARWLRDHRGELDIVFVKPGSYARIAATGAALDLLRATA